MKFLLPKIIATVTIFSILIGGFAFPQNAQAVVPVAEDNPVLLLDTAKTSIATDITSGATVETSAATNIDAAANVAHLSEQLLKWAQETLIQKLKKSLLDYLADRVINYIKGAKDGGFVGDWQSYLSGAIATELDAWGKQFIGVSICAPFSANLQIAIAKPRVPTFSEKYKCDFNDIGVNIEDFYKDFRKGKWIAYEKAWEPQNNIYGLFITASIDQAATAQQRGKAAMAEAQAGAGFLAKKACVEASAIELSRNPNLAGPDLDGDGSPNDDSQSCVTLTPGSTIASVVEKATNADFDYINSLTGTDIGPYIAAIADAMLGRVLDEGLAVVAAHAKPSKPAIGSYVNVGSIERSAAQIFRNQSLRISKDVNNAIGLREDARALTLNATTTWLKYTHNATDIAAEAVRQVKIAKQALDYVYSELSKVTKLSQIKTDAQSTSDPASANTPLRELCRPVRNVSTIDNTALPRIRAVINIANDAVDTLNLAADDYPNINPEYVVTAVTSRMLSGGSLPSYFNIRSSNTAQDFGFSPANTATNPTPISNYDTTEAENLDELALLYEARYELDNELVFNTTTTQFFLGELVTALGNSTVNDARQFKNAMKKIDDNMEEVFKAATRYASRLTKCFNPLDINNPVNGIVVGWDVPTPTGGAVEAWRTRPFPWETSSTPAIEIFEDLPEN